MCVFFFFFFNQCLYIRSTFCAPQGVAILVRSLPKKSKKEKEKRKKLSHDVIYTSATHAGFVHDVTDKDCHTENGSAQSRPFCGIPTCSCFDLEIAELDNTSAVNVFFKLHFHRYDPLGVSCNHYHLRQSWHWRHDWKQTNPTPGFEHVNLMVILKAQWRMSTRVKARRLFKIDVTFSDESNEQNNNNNKGMHVISLTNKREEGKQSLFGCRMSLSKWMVNCIFKFKFSSFSPSFLLSVTPPSALVLPSAASPLSPPPPAHSSVCICFNVVRVCCLLPSTFR